MDVETNGKQKPKEIIDMLPLYQIINSEFRLLYMSESRLSRSITHTEAFLKAEARSIQKLMEDEKA